MTTACRGEEEERGADPAKVDEAEGETGFYGVLILKRLKAPNTAERDQVLSQILREKTKENGEKSTLGGEKKVAAALRRRLEIAEIIQKKENTGGSKQSRMGCSDAQKGRGLQGRGETKRNFIYVQRIA